MNYKRDDALVSTDWLAGHLDDADLKVVDGSWYLPAEKRDPKAEYAEAHLPGAVYFDIDAVADAASPLPHMFPSAEVFQQAVGTLGIANGDRVVCYDGGSMTAAGRVWWMFRAFGHQRVSILNGGSGKWRREGRPMTAELPEVVGQAYNATFDARLVRSVEEVLAIAADGAEQIIDARSAGRFDGTAPEPRAGLRSGHMPGACNLPYNDLLADDGTLKDADELAGLFEKSGIGLDKPVVASCGSGVSATVLLLGLHVLGHEGGSLYDGSWSEWGSREDTPVVR
ncbi:MAG: 3-mercaptopyruvate sulfurtransferase [Alphaproteobacteria bacterium]|jgi:thiosulfate/3-mercaptopyruvate sulfurtransferase|nr:3-mercaptopyruvate sulfurtransferase [Alphaproteobacteria bacterium]